ncbi:MAG: ChbG/HpnK family deacetylase [Schlesneria sp.]
MSARRIESHIPCDDAHQKNRTGLLESPLDRSRFAAGKSNSPEVRRVVFHADDFGMNTAVNLGILTAFRDGLLTSTALLANAPAAETACREWGKFVVEHASGSLFSSEKRRRVFEPLLPFDLGIHLNLTQGCPLTNVRFPSVLLDENGNFPGIGKLFARLNLASSAQRQAVEAELYAQVAWMCDHGLRPTHLNGHQYIEMIPQISIMIPEILRYFSIGTVRVALEPGLVRNVLFRGDLAGWGLAQVKRHFAKAFRRRMLHANASFTERFYGTSHAGRINRLLISRFLSQSMNVGTTEIGVHPAVSLTAEDLPFTDPWFDPLAKLRPMELQWLCDDDLVDELAARGLSLGRLGSL